MRFPILVPKLGLTMEEAEIEAWLKSVGDQVVEGEPLLEISSEKATVEVGSPATGYLRVLSVGPGDVIPVGQQIGLITSTADEPIE